MRRAPANAGELAQHAAAADRSAAEDGADGAPQPTIGLVSCLAFAVGTMVGGGVFTLSGTAVNTAGPAAILSYLLAGTVMLLAALCFVAIAGRARRGDSGYGPVGDLLGPLWRFLAMWGFYINGVMLLTFLLVSFGDYLNQYFLSGLGALAAAVIATAAIAMLNLGPADRVGRAETVVVAVKIAILLFFVAWGLSQISDARFTPFSPGGAHGVLQMTALLFTAYTGFNVVTNMAGSVRDPRRTVPVAVIGSVLISAALYVGVILAMLASGVDHFGDAGVGQAAEALMGGWGGYVIAFAACLSTLSGANANMLGASELMLRLVSQRDVPAALGRTTGHGSPVLSIGLITAVTVLLVSLSNLDNVVAYSNVGALVAMIIVSAAALRLARRGWPGSGLRLPGKATIPAVAIVVCLAQFPSLGWGRVGVGLLLVAAGLLLYFARRITRFGEGVVEAIGTRMLTHDTPLQRALRDVELYRILTRGRHCYRE